MTWEYLVKVDGKTYKVKFDVDKGRVVERKEVGR